MKAYSLLAIALGALPTADAFFRMNCAGPLLRERSDPIVSPGSVSSHLHTIIGGNGFNFTMDYAQARASTCSSCKVKQDLSNYWTPELWVQAKNGSFHVVDHGGAIVYYLQRRDTDAEELHAFPEGFRMVTGDPMLRTTPSDLSGVGFACLDAGQPETKSIPNYQCPGGLRADIFFPSCWDGKNLDSADHKSHVAYPERVNTGKCPASHPVRLVSLFMEVMYDINPWKSEWVDGKHPFVFSNGDPTGFGYHGDFVNGWDVDALDKAVQTCNAESGVVEECAVLDLYTNEEMDNCVIPPSVAEETEGWLPALPGCNPVQSGPARAVAPKTCAATSTIGPKKTYSTDVSKLGWEYVGCAVDSLDTRALPSDRIATQDMTVEKCIAHCSSKGHTFAGLQWSEECFCGDSLDASKLGSNGCTMKCKGDDKQFCGEAQRLSVYKKSGEGTAVQSRKRHAKAHRRAVL